MGSTAAIIALFGNFTRKNANGKIRLTGKGYILCGLAFIGFLFSYGQSYKENIQIEKRNKENQQTVSSITGKLDSLKMLRSQDGAMIDSLNKTIQQLNIKLVEMPLLELENQRKAMFEHNIILKNNILAELQSNIELIESWHDLDLIHFKDSDYFVVANQLSYEALNAGLSLPLDIKVIKILTICIAGIKDINSLSSTISNMMSNAKGKDKNITTLLQLSNRLSDQLKWLKNNIK